MKCPGSNLPAETDAPQTARQNSPSRHRERSLRLFQGIANVPRLDAGLPLLTYPHEVGRTVKLRMPSERPQARHQRLRGFGVRYMKNTR